MKPRLRGWQMAVVIILFIAITGIQAKAFLDSDTVGVLVYLALGLGLEYILAREFWFRLKDWKARRRDVQP